MLIFFLLFSSHFWHLLMILIYFPLCGSPNRYFPFLFLSWLFTRAEAHSFWKHPVYFFFILINTYWPCRLMDFLFIHHVYLPFKRLSYLFCYSSSPSPVFNILFKILVYVLRVQKNGLFPLTPVTLNYAKAVCHPRFLCLQLPVEHTYTCACVWVYVRAAHVCRGQKSPLEPLELEWQHHLLLSPFG